MKYSDLTDLRQTEKYEKYIKALGWKAERIHDTSIFSKELFFWKFVKIQRPNNLIAGDIKSYLNEKFKFSTVYIEPKNDEQYKDLIEVGFRKYNSPFLPSKTIQIDLRKDTDQLLTKMHYKTRYNIKVGTRNNLQIKTSKDIDKFADFWQKCAKERGMFLNQRREIISIYDAFENEAIMHIASKENGDWITSILCVSTKDISYYMYAASTKEGKRLFAPTLLVWEAIESSKKEGKKIFDFEGIYDERFPLKSWKGFTRFKQGFGGVEIEYPSCVSKIII